MIHPAIGGMQSNASAGPLRFVQVANAAPPIVAAIWTAPKGMLRRMVLNLLKPKELTISGPKVVMPPLGILFPSASYNRQQQIETHDMEKIKANQHQVLISSRLSTTWSHFHSVETTPIWLSRSRSTASTLS